MDYRNLNLFPQGSSVRRSRTGAIILGLLFVLGSAAVTNAQLAPPVLFFTDLDSGPNSGGENVAGVSGAYVTLYGNFFGAIQGTSTVTWNGLNCLRVLPATGSYTGWGSSYLWYQKIVVQLGSSCTAGTGSFVVTVNGKPSNGIPFTVRNGNIYCVATSGSDSNSGKFPNCFRNVTKGLGTLTPGDTVYVQGGINVASGGSYSALDWSAQGTAGNPVAMVAYPGASPQPFVGGTAPQSGNAVRCNSGYSTTKCLYATIAGIAMQANTSALWMEFGGNNWRVIANDMTCPNGDGQQGCFTTNEINYVNFYGNYIHDVSSLPGNSSKQYHSVYFSTDSNHIDVGWNRWYNNYSCRDLQFHSSPLGGGGPTDPSGRNQYDLIVHDNLFNGNRCNAINFATVDPSQGPVEAFNNVMMNVGKGPDSTDGTSDYAAILMPNITNTGPTGSGTAEIYNNTLYGNGNQVAFGYPGGAFENDGPTNMTMNLRNNVVVSSLAATSYISHFSTGPITGSNNLWFGAGSGPSQTSANINADPRFVSISGLDLHVQIGSPTSDAGTTISTGNSYKGFPVWNGAAFDRDGVSRPQGSAFDVGAYEYFSGGSTVQKPAPPTNLKVIVQ